MGIDPVGLGLIAALDRLRDDWREDLGGLEGRVMTAIGESGRQFGAYREEHGREHIAQRGDSEAAHKRFDAFISAAAVAQARRDGALGVMKFIADALGRNWKALAAIGGTVALLLGNVHVNVGFQ